MKDEKSNLTKGSEFKEEVIKMKKGPSLVQKKSSITLPGSSTVTSVKRG